MSCLSATRCHRWPIGLLLVAATLLGGRLAWVTAASPLGWRPLFDQWVAIAGGLVGIEHVSLAQQDPRRQAEFWLGEDRKVEAAGRDPRIAAGAAWMLDAPQSGFVQRHFRPKAGNFAGLSLGWAASTELDHEAIDALCEEFERLCRDQCLARIETATELDPSDVAWWRSRALLVFQSKFMGMDLEPRRDDWLDILDQCAERDPDNALYDYLAALGLWSSSTNRGVEDGEWVLHVEDEETFRRGDARFAAGLAKDHLSFGTEGYAATVAFLDESSVQAVDHVATAASRFIDYRAKILLYTIMRWQSVRCDIAKRGGDLEAATAGSDQLLAVTDQISEAALFPNPSEPRLHIRRYALEILEALGDEHPGLLAPDEVERVSTELADVLLDLRVLTEADWRLGLKALSPDGSDVSAEAALKRRRTPVAPFVMASAQALSVVALGLALLSWLGSRLLGTKGDDEQVPMGWSRHVLAWLVGMVGSFVLLGMLLPEKGIERLYMEAGQLREAMQFESRPWIWAFVQWQTQRGAVVGPLLAVTVLLAWHLSRRARRGEGGIRPLLQSGKRRHLRLAGATAASSCLVAALAFLAVYLAVTPTVAESVDRYHQIHRQRMVDSEHARNELAEEIARVRSDEPVMARLREEVAEENRLRAAAREARNGQ